MWSCAASLLQPGRVSGFKWIVGLGSGIDNRTKNRLHQIVVIIALGAAPFFVARKAAVTVLEAIQTREWCKDHGKTVTRKNLRPSLTACS